MNKPHLSWLPDRNGQVWSALWERCCPVRHKIPGFWLEAAPEIAGMKGSRALLLVALTLFCICRESVPLGFQNIQGQGGWGYPRR